MHIQEVAIPEVVLAADRRSHSTLSGGIGRTEVAICRRGNVSASHIAGSRSVMRSLVRVSVRAEAQSS